MEEDMLCNSTDNKFKTDLCCQKSEKQRVVTEKTWGQFHGHFSVLFPDLLLVTQVHSLVKNPNEYVHGFEYMVHSSKNF